ncbi:hypothetical protein LAZ67_12000313, partial [Cordylochernes scorpioides]
MSVFIFPMIEACLSEELMKAWQRSPLHDVKIDANDSTQTRVELIMEFLQKEAAAEQDRALAGSKFGLRSLKQDRNVGRQSHPAKIPMASGLFAGRAQNCIFCNKDHKNTECLAARRMSIKERRERIKNAKCCFSCLQPGHISSNCRRRITECNRCKKKHLDILCPLNAPARESADEDKEQVEGCDASPTVENGVSFSGLSASSLILLQTLKIKVEGATSAKVVRALLDTGSQRSYILSKTAQDLGLSPIGQESLKHVVFGGHTSESVHQEYRVNLGHASGNFKMVAKLLDQQKICGSLPRLSRGPWLKELKARRIWVPDIGKDDMEIEILLGCDVLGSIFMMKSCVLSNGLTASQTRFGWTLMGECQPGSDVSLAHHVTTMTISESSITNLWNLDVLGIMDPIEVKQRDQRDALARRHFLKTVQHSVSGRYVVSLPWTVEKAKIADNREVAMKRLEQTTKKLISLNLYEDYDDIFRGWLDDGIIEKVPAEQHDAEAFYLPHRPVVKLSSGTTPIRPVFDASSKVYRSPSLNDCLEKGPNLIEMIPNLMLRFRNGKFGVVADIKKAFLQIEVNERDRDYLRFLWYSQNREKTEVFRHRRVVFGVNCSPFILGAVIEYHLSNVRPEHKPLAQRLQKSFYVDNLVTSVNSFEELQDLKLTATSIMDNARLELSRWEHSLDVASDTYPFERAEISKVLSLAWDDELDRHYKDELSLWFDDLQLHKGMAIPRNFNPLMVPQKDWQIHTFVDASSEAYAAVVFLRTRVGDKVEVHMMAAKSRVAPLKRPTIPRLELLACVVGTRLNKMIFEALELKDIKNVFWSDATTALAWIKRDDQWGTFVGNRVKEICRLSDPGNWRYVPSECNPADLPSRGCSLSRLIQSRWWEGPSWLKLSEEFWPSRYKDLNEEEICAERKKIAVVTTVKSTDHWYMKYFSSFIKNVRMMAWIRRFINNLRSSTKVKGELSVKEIDEAELALLKLVQAECFPSHSIPGLKVCEVEGILRVKTKLIYSSDEYGFRLPVLLHGTHPLIEQMICDSHVENCHAGVLFLMNKLRGKYWIVKARQTIKKIVRRCVTCRRFSAKPVVVEDAPLPATRVHNAKVFEVVGIDLAGPLYLKDQTKTWVVLFTCAVYRCVHLELVISLSTEDFLMALERFIKRRGRPSTIFSDNGTNFVGANNFFKKIDWERVSNDGKVKRIEWKFIPPTAAWWGGWWERLIRSLKDILKRMLGTSTLTYQQLMTLLCHAEAVMNGRPMTYVSDDPNDLVTISPSMFLQEQTDVEFPECQNMGSNPTTQKLRHLNKLREELKSRFRKEYLSLLVQRNRRIYNPKLQAGDVVLVGMDNKKRNFWPLAVIEEILFGRDGVNRLVKVKTAVGTFLRLIQKIYPLEISSTATSSRLLNDKVKTAKIQTRSGRTICKPNRLDDYLCFSVCLDKNRYYWYCMYPTGTIGTVCILLVLLVLYVSYWYYWYCMYPTGTIGTACILLVLLVLHVSYWYYWYCMYPTGTIGTACILLVLLVLHVSYWYYWYCMYPTGTVGTACILLVLMVLHVSYWYYWYCMYPTGTVGTACILLVLLVLHVSYWYYWYCMYPTGTIGTACILLVLLVLHVSYWYYWYCMYPTGTVGTACILLVLLVLHVSYWYCWYCMYPTDTIGTACILLVLLVLHVSYWYCWYCMYPTGTIGTACILLVLLVLLVLHVSYWYYWYCMYPTGTVGTACILLILLVLHVSYWYCWYCMYPTGTVGTACILLVLLVLHVSYWYYWYCMYPTGTIGTACILMVLHVSYWYYWYCMYPTGTIGTACILLVLLVLHVSYWYCWYCMYPTGTIGTAYQKDEKEKNAWIIKDAKVQKYIISSIDKTILTHIIHCENAKSMYDTICRIFERDDEQLKCKLLQEFHTYKFDKNVDLVANISNLRNLAFKLNNLKQNFDDNIVISKILTILPEEYNYFCTAWESTGKDEKTIENLISRLTTEEIRRNRQSQPEDRVAMNATKQKVCFTCNKPGHISKNCTQRKFCKFCKKTNHEEKDCFFKNNSKPAAKVNKEQCRICKKFNHKEKDCYFRNKEKQPPIAFIAEQREEYDKRSSVTFIVDSGSTCHMINEEKLLDHQKKCDVNINVAKKEE